MKPGMVLAAARVLAESIFPGRCLLCGQWLLFDSDHDAPLCTGCRADLVPLGGPRCGICGMPLVSESHTCMRCRAAGFAFRSNVALFPNTDAARRLIADLKFGGRRRLARLFARFVADALKGDPGPLVPVPPRPGRRSPDAAELVARSLSRSHGIRVRRLLARSSGTQQKSLDLRQRRENLKGKITLACPGSREAFPSHVVLLDDVFTTGATLDACARVLRDAGCAAVDGITLVIEE